MNIHATKTSIRVMSLAVLLLLSGCISPNRPQVVTNDTRTRLAKALLEAGDPASAAEAMRTPATRETANASDRLTDAEILVESGQVDAGLNLAEAALAVRPNDTGFALGVASLAVKGNRLTRADQIYRTILSRHPDNIEAINGVAVVLAQSGRLPDAIATLRQALARHPGDVPTQNNLALMLLLDGQAAAALPILENLDRSAPSAQVESALSVARAKATAEAPLSATRQNGIEPSRHAQDSQMSMAAAPAPQAVALPAVQPAAIPIDEAGTPSVSVASPTNTVPVPTSTSAEPWSCPAVCRLMHSLFDKQGQAEAQR